MKFLFIIFSLFLFIIVFLGGILGRIIRFFASKDTNTTSKRSQSQSRNKENMTPENTKKYISKNVGEYVNYEEIKDE